MAGQKSSQWLPLVEQISDVPFIFVTDIESIILSPVRFISAVFLAILMIHLWMERIRELHSIPGISTSGSVLFASVYINPDEMHLTLLINDSSMPRITYRGAQVVHSFWDGGCDKHFYSPVSTISSNHTACEPPQLLFSLVVHHATDASLSPGKVSRLRAIW